MSCSLGILTEAALQVADLGPRRQAHARSVASPHRRIMADIAISNASRTGRRRAVAFDLAQLALGARESRLAGGFAHHGSETNCLT